MSNRIIKFVRKEKTTISPYLDEGTKMTRSRDAPDQHYREQNACGPEGDFPAKETAARPVHSKPRVADELRDRILLGPHSSVPTLI